MYIFVTFNSSYISRPSSEETYDPETNFRLQRKYETSRFYHSSFRNIFIYVLALMEILNKLKLMMNRMNNASETSSLHIWIMKLTIMRKFCSSIIMGMKPRPAMNIGKATLITAGIRCRNNRIHQIPKFIILDPCEAEFLQGIDFQQISMNLAELGMFEFQLFPRKLCTSSLRLVAALRIFKLIMQIVQNRRRLQWFRL